MFYESEGCVCTESTTSCQTKPVKVMGYRYASWGCEYGKEEKQGSKSSCKPSSMWKKYAVESCLKDCPEEVSSDKCGVSSFSISGECVYETKDISETEAIVSQDTVPSVSTESVTSSGSGGGQLGKIESEDNTSSGTDTSEILVCKNSCSLDSKCYPLGYRKSGNYCSEEGSFVLQLESDKSCENNFECDSNICVDSKCISGGLFSKIMDWFKNLFG